MIKSSLSSLLAISFGVSVTLIATRSSADERCAQLEALHTKYAAVQLTPDQKELKAKLVAWYMVHCRGHQVADVNPAALLNAER